MPSLGYRKQQKLIADFREFVYEYRHLYNSPRNSNSVLEKLAQLENLQFRSSSPSRADLCSSLTALLRYMPETEIEIIKKATELLLKYAQDWEKRIVCYEWSDSRTTALADLLRTQRWIAPCQPEEDYFTTFLIIALKFGYEAWLEEFLANFEIATHCSALAHALGDGYHNDIEIIRAAQLFCERLPASYKQPVFEQFATWRRYDYSIHIPFLAEQDFYSSSNLKIAIRVALTKGTFFDKIEENSATVQRLVELLEDRSFATQAEAVLRNLRTKEAQSALCDLFLEQNNSQAETIAVECDYKPLKTARKVLFFFLTRQVARYDALDFDHRILRGFYEVAEASMRHRITQAVKQSGNPAYIDILSLKQDSFAVEISNTQSKTMLQVLRDNEEWPILWQKALELPFIASVSALGRLLKTGWQPPDPAENQLYQKLANLVRSRIAQPSQLKTALPVAVRLASLQTGSKLNDFVFTPDSQRLVIAPTSRKLIFWDFLHGREEKSLTGLSYAPNHLKFNSDGTLFCAEQPSNRRRSSAVYSWSSWEDSPTPRKLDEQVGAVKLLEPLPGNRLLVVREGHFPQVLSASTGQVEATLAVEEVRAALVIPKQNILVLAGQRFWAFDLSSLAAPGNYHVYGCSCFEAVLYEPTSEKILTGSCSTHVQAFSPSFPLGDDNWHFTSHYSFGGSKERDCAVLALANLPQHDLVVAGAADGRIAFSSSVRQKWSLVFRTPSQALSSLQISPDGQFMAVAESATTLSLWDLRPLDIHKLLVQPLLHATAQHMLVLRLLEEHSADIAAPVQNSLAYIREILRHRFRYDIEIEAVPEIVPGNFDIEL